MEPNDFSSCGRGSPKKHFRKIILKSGHWSRSRCHLKVFLFLALAAISFSAAERFSNYGTGSPKGHFFEIILKSIHCSRTRCHLKVLLFEALAADLFSKEKRF